MSLDELPWIKQKCFQNTGSVSLFRAAVDNVPENKRTSLSLKSDLMKHSLNLMKHLDVRWLNYRAARCCVFDCMKSSHCMDGSQRGASSPVSPLILLVGRPHGTKTPPYQTHRGCSARQCGWKCLAENWCKHLITKLVITIFLVTLSAVKKEFAPISDFIVFVLWQMQKSKKSRSWQILFTLSSLTNLTPCLCRPPLTHKCHFYHTTLTPSSETHR